MSGRQALQYYGQWLRLTFDPTNKAFKSARNFAAFFGPPALLFLLPLLNKHYPVVGPHMSEYLLYAPILLVVIALPIFFLLAPYRIHEEQGQQIESLNQKLYNRALLQTQCDAIADLIDEGKRTRRLYVEESVNPATNEAELWMNKVRTYLQENFGRASIIQWENDGGLALPESPQDTLRLLRPLGRDGSHLPNFSFQSRKSQMHHILTVRLTRLHELLTKLQDKLI